MNTYIEYPILYEVGYEHIISRSVKITGESKNIYGTIAQVEKYIYLNMVVSKKNSQIRPCTSFP